MECKYEEVYLVLFEDELVYASEGKEFAEAYIGRKIDEIRESNFYEMKKDKEDISDCLEVEYQIGYDSDEEHMYEMHKVELQGKSVRDWMEVDGKEISVSSIYRFLENSHFEEFY